MAKATRWLLEGLAVAAFAAGAFLLPWVWVKFFPLKGPYTRSLSPRAGLRLPAPEPIRAVGHPALGMRLSSPTPLPGEKLIFVDLRRRPQTLTAYEGLVAVGQYRLTGSRLREEDIGSSRVRGKSRRHWYAPGEQWIDAWMSLEPLAAPARRQVQSRGYGGILAEPESGHSLPPHVRLPPEDARELWEWADIGTPVYVYRYRRQQSGLPGLLERARALAKE